MIETTTGTLLFGCKTSAIPDDGSVTKIGRYAFEGCSGLTEITIPDSVTEIGERAFAERTGLTQVTLGSEAIGRQAFYGCTGLAQIMLGDGVAKIGDNTFDGCSALESITVKGENTHYSSQDGILYNKAKTEFIHVPKAIKGAVTIPDSMKKIEGKAFSGCEGLTQVTIGSGVSRIESGAFEGCSNLQRVIFQKTSGWVCFDGETDVRILPTDLEDGETAALYLKFTYSDALWRRTD